MTSFARRIKEALLSASVPGVGLAILSDGKVQDVVTLGARDTSSQTPVDRHTAFEA